MKPKKAYTMTAVGSSSFLLIFTILALVTFAALALSTAVADNRLSAKTTESTTAYYTAANAAEDTLAAVDDALATAQAQGGADPYAAIPQALPAGCTWDEAHRTIAFTQAISDTQRLRVTLTANEPTPGQPLYTLNQWQVETTDTWQPDQGVPVITLN